jgi:hypothetical protein
LLPHAPLSAADRPGAMRDASSPHRDSMQSSIQVNQLSSAAASASAAVVVTYFSAVVFLPFPSPKRRVVCVSVG